MLLFVRPGRDEVKNYLQKRLPHRKSAHNKRFRSYFRLQVFPFRAQVKEKATRRVVNDNVASNSTGNCGCGSAKYSRDGLALVEGKGY